MLLYKSLVVLPTLQLFLVLCVVWIANSVWTHEEVFAARVTLLLDNEGAREMYGHLGIRWLPLASGCTFVLHSPWNPRARTTLIQPLTSHRQSKPSQPRSFTLSARKTPSTSKSRLRWSSILTQSDQARTEGAVHDNMLVVAEFVALQRLESNLLKPRPGLDGYSVHPELCIEISISPCRIFRSQRICVRRDCTSVQHYDWKRES
jgi:hypothetical protein